MGWFDNSSNKVDYYEPAEKIELKFEGKVSLEINYEKEFDMGAWNKYIKDRCGAYYHGAKKTDEHFNRWYHKLRATANGHIIVDFEGKKHRIPFYEIVELHKDYLEENVYYHAIKLNGEDIMDKFKDKVISESKKHFDNLTLNEAKQIFKDKKRFEITFSFETDKDEIIKK
ncbi:hypothetical protein PQE75_gp203 [Bacillus phage vB_BcoS-136]|uniref:Uncharacterized protein n=1 Tax=Bacillus phage vB_BcoS-136 TaxID=2419619 RepID=A0A3G3BW11_9CAUD|nr:hypothetical protein PQE75_gp203 [Bacillus phage vB_BcoS-136]AYP68276.1 hypothetical protein vBBcoS136_00162 [Bacillus phage vB_BcoS-136]